MDGAWNPAALIVVPLFFVIVFASPKFLEMKCYCFEVADPEILLAQSFIRLDVIAFCCFLQPHFFLLVAHLATFFVDFFPLKKRIG